MQQTLELALDRAEYVIESARQRPPKRKHSSGSRKSVFHKLYDLYIEECEKEPEVKKLRRNVNLLEKLVMQESLSCLVVNLYPGNEGYSLMLRGKNGSDSETIKLPYEEGELLDYIDAEELPPILVDLLEKAQVNIFHCGCVITEIRDYRQSGNLKSPTYQTRHVLLRPTMQTLVSDIHAITSDNHKWTQEDKLLLESQLILATADPLCLDPSISVACTTNRLLYNKQKMNTCPMKRCLKRYSRPALNRQQELSNCPIPPQLKLLDYLHKRKERKASQPQFDLKISKTGNYVDLWKQNPCSLAVPSEVDVEKYAKVEKSIKLDDSQPTVWPADETKEDYIFECENGTPFQKAKLTVFQNVGNPLYFGKMHASTPDEEDAFHNAHSQFLIGSKIDIDRVVSQYQDLFKNESKGFVKMTYNAGGVSSQSPLSPGKEIESDGISGSIQSSMLGKGVKHRPPPIKLPSNSGSSSSSGNIFSPQQSSGHLKSTTPPPSKPPSISRKQSVDLNQVCMLSPAAVSPAGSSQRSGTPKPSTPTPTNTPSSTPHPPDVSTSASLTPSVTPTPQDSGFNTQPTLIAPFAQQQMSLSQGLPVMTIPLSTMVTSITTGTASTQVMTNPAGLNIINVVGCGPQALMSGSNTMLGCSTGAITPAGINLSGILPSGGLVPGTMPAAMQSASQAGGPFGIKNNPNLRPLNLLQLPSLIFNPMQQQQQPQLSQYSPQQSQQTSTSSPQQSDQLGLLPSGMEQGPSSQEQTLTSQQAAVINLTGVGGFMPQQTAVLSQLGSAVNRPGHKLPHKSMHLSPSLQLQKQQAMQQQQPPIQLQFLQHRMHQMAMAAAQAPPHPPPRSDSRSRNK
ncbi:transcription factor SPT20 homolog isoform X1 [Dendropsophus ebraccatus]|uniref:transcription factor SPT20 homolog isoform X1 n=1 Tax=Dendropsophus ebraccatus TaxID=150705 RepID=UPI00383228D9